MYFTHGDVYINRRSMGSNNCAIPMDRCIPGTVSIMDGEYNDPSIICLYGQYCPGISSYNNIKYPIDYPDKYLDRLKYFEEGLNMLLDYFESEYTEYPSIAVPLYIGCYRRRYWKKYLCLLDNFHIQIQKYGGRLVFYTE